MNAPRLLFEVEGDFIVQVRVSGDFQPSLRSTVTGRPAIVAGGLLLWTDANNYLRLERMAAARSRIPRFVNWDLRRDGQPTLFGQSFPALLGEETYLLMQRRSNQIRGFVSNNGNEWIEVKPIDLEWPKKVKVGIIALSLDSAPFAVSFDRLQLQIGQGKMTRIDLPSTE